MTSIRPFRPVAGGSSRGKRQRDREIAVRLALDATGANVRRLVLVEAGRLVGVGALLGVGGAVAGTRFLRGRLFDVQPIDPVMQSVDSQFSAFSPASSCGNRPQLI